MVRQILNKELRILSALLIAVKSKSGGRPSSRSSRPCRMSFAVLFIRPHFAFSLRRQVRVLAVIVDLPPPLWVNDRVPFLPAN
jgi:hypothetical protein